eukprot:2275826-Karenia_brevis.AAC.1
MDRFMWGIRRRTVISVIHLMKDHRWNYSWCDGSNGKSPPPVPAGLDGCDEATVKKWKESGYAMAPYQFKKANGIMDDGKERPLNASE